MSDIITLAQFDFDLDKLEKGIKEMQKQLLELTKRQQELNKQAKEVNKTLESQTKESDRLVDNFKKGSLEYQKATKEQIKLKEAGEESTQAYQDLNIEKEKLISAFKEESIGYKVVSKEVEDLAKKQEDLFLSTKDLQIQRDVLNKEYRTATTLYKQFIGVSGESLSLQEVINQSVKQEVTTRQQAKEVNQQLNKIKDQLNLTNENELQLLNEINKRIDVNNALLKESGSENEKRTANIGLYTDSIREAVSSLDIFNGGLGGFIARSNQAGGAGELLKGTFTEIKTGVTGITKSLLASPIGFVLGLIGGLTMLGKEFIEYNAEIAKTDKLIRGITKTTAEETTKIRLLGSAMKETFGTDIEDTVQTAKVLVNEFGITYEEAMNQIREGLIRGQEGNKQYLDSLREYSTFFKQAGYSVEEFRSIVSAGYDLGIYNDKLPDALKEFGLSITEQTKASRDALVNAFGTEFTESLLKRVKEGSIGVNDALKEISEQAKISNLDLKQQAELTASVFRGAGEDAGGALKIFEAVNKAYVDQTRELTELEQKTKDLADANDELAKAKDAALNSDAVNTFKKDFELLWISAKTYMYQFMSGWNNTASTVKAILIGLYNTFVEVFGKIRNIIGNFDITNPLKSLKEFSEIDFQKTFAKNTSEVLKQQKETKRLADEEKARQDQNALNAGQEEARRKAAEEAKAKADKLDKAASDAAVKRIDLMIAKQKEQLDLWIAQQGDKARTLQEELTLQEEISKKSIAILDNELKNKKISQEKYDLEVLKLSQGTARLQAEIGIQATTIELDRIEHENKSKLEKGQLLTDDLLMQEIERNQLIRDERDKFAKSQFDQGLINNTEYQKVLLENEREFLEEGKNLREKNQADNRTIETARRAQEFQANLLQLQENLANEFEIRKAQAQFEFDENKLQLEQQRADGLITEENYQLALNNIISENAKVKKEIDKDLLNAKLSGYEGAFGALSEFLGKESAAGKAAALAQALINTYQGITAGVALGFPLSIPAVAMASLTGFAAVKNIVATKTPSVSKGAAPKMAKGGLTEIGGKLHSQGGTKFYGEDGTSFEAEKGELIGVMNRSAAANFMNYNNSFLSGGSKTFPNYFANGGMVGLKPSNNAAVLQNLFGNFDTSSITEAVRQGAMQGTQQGSFEGSYQGSQVGSQQGISQLSSDRAMQGDSLL